MPAFNEVERFVQSVSWRVSRSKPFGTARHINVQELREVVREARELPQRSPGPGRFLAGGDSNVVLGCWTKGRSGSIQLNVLLREGAAWCIFARKQILGFRLGTKWNPSDDPTRFVDTRTPW